MPFFVRDSDEGSTGRGGPMTPVVPRKRWRMHLAELWGISQLLFGCCMLSTLFVSTSPGYQIILTEMRHSFIRSVAGATVMVTLTGFSWAITQWAPFSLVRLPPVRPGFRSTSDLELSRIFSSHKPSFQNPARPTKGHPSSSPIHARAAPGTDEMDRKKRSSSSAMMTTTTTACTRQRMAPPTPAS
jgi:hypothetical protein